MLYKLKKTFATHRFYRQTRAILDSRPMPALPGQVTMVSMVGDGDVHMYLLAMKSFYRLIGSGKLVAIHANTMPAASLALLSSHFPGIDLQPLESIDVGSCQRGGTWERLVYLLRRSETEYVIQMDCDTLCVGADLQEVLDCVRDNRAFMLSGGEKEIVSLPEAARRARTITHPYVGIAAESLFDHYPQAESLRYGRGSSGFAGFSRGGFSQAQLEAFNAQMLRLLPERWTEWGTEQCASNFAVSNSPGSVVLPHPKYGNFDHHHDPTSSSFLHFIGAHRFDDGLYAKLACRVIEELRH